MGYDMHWRNEPAEVADAKAVVYAASSATREQYDAWNAAEEKHGSYFRLNIFGMGRYRTYMHERGMLDVDSSQPAFPEHANYGVTEVEYQDYPEDESEQTPAYKTWRQAIRAWTDASPGGKMPVYKFGSNDGWLVTPDEITKSLQALEEWERKQRDLHGQSWVDPLRAEEEGYWDKWIRFLYCARGFGGFEVH